MLVQSNVSPQVCSIMDLILPAHCQLLVLSFFTFQFILSLDQFALQGIIDLQNFFQMKNRFLVVCSSTF